MGKLWTALASYCGSALWWLCDKIWGDRIFAILKPMIPDWAVQGVPLAEILRQAQTWVPPIILVLIGTALFVSQRRRLMAAATATVTDRERTPTAVRRSIPITPDSIFSFLNGYPIVRETDQAIANDLGLQIEEDHFPAEALANAVRHFGVASLSDLETLLRDHQETVIELSRYFRPKGSGGKPAKLTRGHSVHMLLEMLAARTSSVEKYMAYTAAIGATCGKGFAQNVIDAYREIAQPANNTSAFPRGLHISRIWIQYPHLEQRSVIHININGFNGTGEDIFLKMIEGAIRVTDENGKPIYNLGRPTFAGVRDNRIAAYGEFCVTLEQDVTKRFASELMTANPLDRRLVFENLNIVVQASTDPQRTARFPLWDAAMLVRDGGNIRADRVLFLRQ
jgi:hypothetical protein